MKRPRGTGCLYRRAGTSVWWIKYSRNGRAISESSHTSDKRKAGNLLRKRLGEIGAGTFLGPQIERVMVAELAEDFLSEYRANNRRSIASAQVRWLLHLKPFFGVCRAVEVTTPLLTRYIESRRQQGAKNATCNRELAALKRMFNLGRVNQKVRYVPIFPKLQEDNPRSGFLEDGRYRKLVEHAELWFRAMLEVSRTYGWRKQEVLKMRVSQLDLLERTIRLEPGTTKNRDGREVSMTDGVYTLLKACVIAKAQDDYVFTRDDGKRVRDYRKAWSNACAAAGLGKFICKHCQKDFTDAGRLYPDCSQPLKYTGLMVHDLRRTAARNLRRAGIAEGVIMKIGGWKTRSVFERYNIVNQADIREAMAKFEASEQKTEPVAENGYSSVTVAPKTGPVANLEKVN
jgi:integrase